MAIIEITDGGQSFDLSNLAFTGMLDYIISNCRDAELVSNLEEAKEYGYLTLDEMPREHADIFVQFVKSYSKALSIRKDVPEEYLARFVNLARQLELWLSS